MDFSLTEEQEAMQAMAKNFAEKKIAPTMEEDEKEHKFRREIVKEMARLGFFGCIAPEKYGGTESGYLAASVMTEEVARVSPSWGLPFNLQMNSIQSVLLAFGTEEQRQRWIPKLINADLLGCFAITEPNTGSDVASMKSTAIEAEGGFVLNGTKMWISGVPVADLGIVYVYTDKAASIVACQPLSWTCIYPGSRKRPSNRNWVFSVLRQGRLSLKMSRSQRIVWWVKKETGLRSAWPCWITQDSLLQRGPLGWREPASNILSGMPMNGSSSASRLPVFKWSRSRLQRCTLKNRLPGSLSIGPLLIKTWDSEIRSRFPAQNILPQR